MANPGARHVGPRPNHVPIHEKLVRALRAANYTPVSFAYISMAVWGKRETSWHSIKFAMRQANEIDPKLRFRTIHNLTSPGNNGYIWLLSPEHAQLLETLK